VWALERYLYFMDVFHDRRKPPAAYRRVLDFLEFAGGSALPAPVAVTAGEWDSVHLHHRGVMKRGRWGSPPPPFFAEFRGGDAAWRDVAEQAIYMTLPTLSAVEIEWGDYHPEHIFVDRKAPPVPRYVRLWGDGYRVLRPIITWSIIIAWRTQFDELGPGFLRWTAGAEAAFGAAFKRSRWRWWEIQPDGSVRLRLVKRDEWIGALSGMGTSDWNGTGGAPLPP
jgi:hypothetical protein